MAKKRTNKTRMFLRVDFVDRYGNNSGWLKKRFSLLDANGQIVKQDSLMCNIDFFAQDHGIKIIKE